MSPLLRFHVRDCYPHCSVFIVQNSTKTCTTYCYATVPDLARPCSRHTSSPEPDSRHPVVLDKPLPVSQLTNQFRQSMDAPLNTMHLLTTRYWQIVPSRLTNLYLHFTIFTWFPLSVRPSVSTRDEKLIDRGRHLLSMWPFSHWLCSLG